MKVFCSVSFRAGKDVTLVPICNQAQVTLLYLLLINSIVCKMFTDIKLSLFMEPLPGRCLQSVFFMRSCHPAGLPDCGFVKAKLCLLHALTTRNPNEHVLNVLSYTPTEVRHIGRLGHPFLSVQ